MGLLPLLFCGLVAGGLVAAHVDVPRSGRRDALAWLLAIDLFGAAVAMPDRISPGLLRKGRVHKRLYSAVQKEYLAFPADVSSGPHFVDPLGQRVLGALGEGVAAPGAVFVRPEPPPRRCHAPVLRTFRRRCRRRVGAARN